MIPFTFDSTGAAEKLATYNSQSKPVTARSGVRCETNWGVKLSARSSRPNIRKAGSL